MLPRMDFEEGAEITLSLDIGVNGAHGIHGTIQEIVRDGEGGVIQLAIEEEGRPDPLWVRGELIAMWRFGEPVTRGRVLQGVPDGLIIK